MRWKENLTSLARPASAIILHNKRTARNTICKLGGNSASLVEARGAVMGPICHYKQDLEVISMLRSRIADM